jgi:hypothetical protein
VSLSIERRLPRRQFFVLVGALALVLCACLATAVGARAAERVYWNNYGTDPAGVASAELDGSGGALLNLGATEFETPEGMAYDSVTNRIFVGTDAATSQIVAINLDGSGSSVFSPPGAPVSSPEGVTLDPLTRKIYWINTGEKEEPASISWANLDGSVGGVLNTIGANVENAYRLAIDPVAGRLYWGNDGLGGSTIEFAKLDNSGGGSLNIAGATAPESISGVSVDPAGGRVYWVDNDLNRVSFARLDNSGGGDVNFAGAIFLGPYGIAFDPTQGKFYWGNYNNSNEERTGAIGVGFLSGSGGGINIAPPLPLEGPQDPLILKSPSAGGAPTLTKSHGQLTCSQGTWGADFPGSFVYQAPRSFAYQWTNNGTAIAGATSSTLNATAPGSYACTVTATNQTGTASQTSAATTVAASKVALKTKRKARVKPGGFATFSIQAANHGDLTASRAQVCATVPKSKKAKKSLKAPKCQALQPLAGAGVATVKVKIKVKPKAKSGTYNVAFKVTGSAGLTAKAKLIVKAPKPKKHQKK